MRLGGWQRLGIVASAIWVPYGWNSGVYEAVAVGNPEWLLDGLILAFAPVIAGWIGVVLIIRTVRWVWRGFVL